MLFTHLLASPALADALHLHSTTGGKSFRLGFNCGDHMERRAAGAGVWQASLGQGVRQTLANPVSAPAPVRCPGTPSHACRDDPR